MANKVVSGEAWITSESKSIRERRIARALLALSSGVIGIAAAAIYLEDKQTPFYRQVRIGRDGESFVLTKLRTMPVCAQTTVGEGPSDDRATQIGKRLRHKGIDELPQLKNVIRGDMSLVGPRPILDAAVQEMRDVLSPSEYAEWYRAYTLGRPGITGLFAVASRALDPTSDAYLYARAELDVKYSNTASPSLDLAILRASVFKEEIALFDMHTADQHGHSPVDANSYDQADRNHSMS